MRYRNSKMCSGRGRPGNKTTSGKGNRGSSLTAIEEGAIGGLVISIFLFYLNGFSAIKLGFLASNRPLAPVSGHDVGDALGNIGSMVCHAFQMANDESHQDNGFDQSSDIALKSKRLVDFAVGIIDGIV